MKFIAKLFKQVLQVHLSEECEKWIKTLDWFLDGNKFPSDQNWEKKYVGKMTMRIKKLKLLENAKIVYDYGDKIVFPNNGNYRANACPCIIMAKKIHLQGILFAISAMESLTDTRT